MAAAVRDRWGAVDGFVLFVATGVAVRVVGPLLGDKHHDPAVVCVDEAGRYAVALVGGHAGGANSLAREVAALLGAEPVITTGSDAAGLPALDLLPGFTAEGDVAGVTRASLDGVAPAVSSDLPGWPLPPSLRTGPQGPSGPSERGEQAPHRVLVTDRLVPEEAGLVVLRPPSLVVGVGTSSGAPPADVAGLVAAALADHGLAAASLSEVATIDRRANEAAILGLGL
ncbi:MAG: cobalamin biosynthesis protein, partial [Actinobacteria bacterium]|nr:cobalamin biosynthesis protein [Actinomycetota bacterium]